MNVDDFGDESLDPGVYNETVVSEQTRSLSQLLKTEGDNELTPWDSPDAYTIFKKMNYRLFTRSVKQRPKGHKLNSSDSLISISKTKHIDKISAETPLPLHKMATEGDEDRNKYFFRSAGGGLSKRPQRTLPDEGEKKKFDREGIRMKSFKIKTRSPVASDIIQNYNPNINDDLDSSNPSLFQLHFDLKQRLAKNIGIKPRNISQDELQSQEALNKFLVNERQVFVKEMSLLRENHNPLLVKSWRGVISPLKLPTENIKTDLLIKTSLDSKDQPSNKLVKSAGPFFSEVLNGQKTQLNSFEGKLSSTGKQIFGKAHKSPEPKAEKGRYGVYTPIRTSDDIKSKLEILRKMGRSTQFPKASIDKKILPYEKRREKLKTSEHYSEVKILQAKEPESSTKAVIRNLNNDSIRTTTSTKYQGR